VNESTQAKFCDALNRYNRGEYLDCQELLEEVYRESDASEQPLVRAIAMLASAMHLHFKRGGGRGVLNLLRLCLVTLDDYRPRHLGVAVDELHEAVEAYLQDLQDRRKPGAGFFDRWLAPRIRCKTP